MTEISYKITHARLGGEPAVRCTGANAKLVMPLSLWRAFGGEGQPGSTGMTELDAETLTELSGEQEVYAYAVS
ncbi:hypothetical protein FLK61_35435 [Paenalkalicoccus suaedae]|uniref:Uncharacterized protein n=1 Tax=Paenalkalicoccus suaedae TaxID=2592382 RepID=A0A859FG17_9BACI|nr:hypothetical protein [Paenalkalicoccus suaedae]QKS71961.1 hypothetical protein FLK61_35435 [Paenalkalicoccus suaedae]